MFSKHEEQSKCPFLLQKVFLDLSISFLQIRHLNMGVISFEENIIKGCQSKVWLKHFYDNEKLTFFGDSNTAITKGLLSLLIHIFNNRTPKEILESKLFFINDTGLCRFIGTQRSNGLEAMENKFKFIALNNIENG